jgi:hypothetical protein
MRLHAIAAVLAVNVALAGGLAYLWSDEQRSRWAEPPAVQPSIEDVAAAPASEPIDVSKYRETLERPLFAATRKVGPRKDAAAEAEAAADALKDVRLLGTYGAGERGGIIVVSGGKVQRLPVGEGIGGWKVAGAGEGRSAELVRADGQRRKLELALNSVAPASAAPKGGAPEATSAPSAVPAQPTDAAGPAASQRAGGARAAARTASPVGGGAEQAASPEERQQRLERINQRRAARGLPPMAP